MDIYDTRRENLLSLIKQLNMSYAAFGKLVGYNGAYIGQLVNRTKRSSGSQALVTDKVITKILSHLKDKEAQNFSRTWFDIEQVPEHKTKKVTTTVNVADPQPKEFFEPPAPLIDDERFPDHLQSTWPYMSEEQRAALRYLEAGFRAQRKNK